MSMTPHATLLTTTTTMTLAAALMALSADPAHADGAHADASIAGAAAGEVSISGTVTAEVTVTGAPVAHGSVAHGSVAHGRADTGVSRGSSARGFRADHWEASVGVLGGLSMDIGRIEAHEPWGLQLAAGRQIGPVRLTGDFSLVSFSGCLEREKVEGQLHRIGASARYRLPLMGETDIFGRPETDHLGFYLGGGIGRQSVRYKGGGHSARTDAMVELGMEFAAGSKHFAGFDIGLRIHAAGRPPVPVELPHGSMSMIEDHTMDITAVGTISLLLGR